MDEKRRSSKRGAGSDETTSKDKPNKDNDSTVSNTPRKRVSQACDRCRSRKDKCDGEKPRCSTCASLDQVCSYDPATKKRGLPEGYVRGLEKLWGLTIREAFGVEDTVLGLLGNGLDPDNEALLKIWNDRDELETLQETWRRSRLSQELERLLPVLEFSEDKSVKRKRPEAIQSRADVSVESSQILSARPLDSEFKFPFHGISAGDYSHNSEGFPPHVQRRRFTNSSDFAVVETATSSPPTFDLPQRAWTLLDIYFSYTHCWLPIIEKSDMLRTSYLYSTKPLNISCSLPGSGDHAALWAILAYADHQNHAIKDGSQAQVVAEDFNVDNLYSHARNLVPLEDGAFELGHVQALLILALLSMGRNQWDRAWLLVGQAVRIAVNLGLDEGIKDVKSVAKRTRSTHAFLGCFVLDTIIAAYLGRTPQLSNEDVKRVGLIEEDGSDEWNPWTDTLGVRRGNESGPRGPVAVLSTFNRLIKLVEILNAITRDVSTGSRRTETCQRLMNDLSSWEQVLPSQFASTASSREASGLSLLPHQYHLHLAHIGIISALYGHMSSSSEAVQVSDQTLSDTFATAARQAMWLLMRQSETFGLLIVPPTFDYFVSIACDKVQGIVTDKHISHADWELNMQHYIKIMTKAWPTFQGRRQLFLPKASTSQYKTLQSTVNPDAQTTNPSHRASFHGQQPSLSGTTFSFREGPLTSTDTPMSQSSTAFTPSQYDPLLELSNPNNPRTLSGSTPNWADLPSTTPQYTAPAQTDFLTFAHHGSIGSDIDGDSMFNEFATLDAMEWTNNWDQSLLNLGFTDPENMHSDFYAFAREPDPLYSSNLVQQLLSVNGGTGRPNLNQGTMLSDTTLGDGNAAGLVGSFSHGRERMFSGSNPHVEASQILQALSGSGEGKGKGG